MSTSSDPGSQGKGKTGGGKITDPVFVFMVVAVVLAVGSSFALRAVVRGLGPSAAHAADGPDGATADDPLGGDHIILDASPLPRMPTTMPETQPATRPQEMPASPHP